MSDSSFPNIKVTIRPECDHFVMLQSIISLHAHQNAIDSMFFSMYARMMNLPLEDALKEYRELRDESVTQLQALYSKYGEIELSPPPS